ncbi:MAG: thiol peroxidase [Chloroflexi bacterium]|nr:thiol peroxidase [Chloroflexota bacterium]
MIERTGEAFEGDVVLTVAGRQLQPGDPAPDFALDHIHPDDSSISTVQLADTAGAVRLLNIVNSLDTPVCHIETHRWDDLRLELPPEVVVYTVSMDLPYAQARWQTAEGVAHPMLSAHRSERFGEDYGVLLREWRLLQRAVIVIAPDGQVVHAEYVADQMLEPDYGVAAEAARRAAASS